MVYQKRQHCSQWEERKDTVRIEWPLMGQRWAKLAGLTAKPHTVALQVTLPSAAWLFLKSTLVVDRRQLPQKVFHSLGETGCEGSFTRSLPSCSIFPLFRDWGLLLPPSPPLPFAKPLTAVWGKFLESDYHHRAFLLSNLYQSTTGGENLYILETISSQEWWGSGTSCPQNLFSYMYHVGLWNKGRLSTRLQGSRQQWSLLQPLLDSSIIPIFIPTMEGSTDRDNGGTEWQNDHLTSWKIQLGVTAAQLVGSVVMGGSCLSLWWSSRRRRANVGRAVSDEVELGKANEWLLGKEN